MSREEAIEVIRKEYACVDRDCDIERSCGKCDLMMPSKELILKAYEAAIQALSQEGGYCCRTCKHTRINKDGIWCEEPTFQWEQAVTNSEAQEPCDEVVSRQAALNSLIDNTHLDGYDLAEALDAIENKEKLPSVTQKSGKWIALENRFELGDRVKCSECGQVFVVGDDVSRNFCPNCGAKMVEPQESEEQAE